MIFDRLVKNLNKCLTYPSATKDERYKGRGDREEVDQTEGGKSQTSRCHEVFEKAGKAKDLRRYVLAKKSEK